MATRETAGDAPANVIGAGRELAQAETARLATSAAPDPSNLYRNPPVIAPEDGRK